jgi:hypothetical protein
MSSILQKVYPGITAKDYKALLEKRYTKHMMQILLERSADSLGNLPDSHGHYLTADELCNESGLSLDSLEQLSAVRLLLPDHEGKFRPRLLRWARKLASLLDQGWNLDEIKRWAKGRFRAANPSQWPPNKCDWER